MPSWTRKDERQYEHIRDSQIDRGTGEDRAEEIAARTVNKRRRTEGRTPNHKTQGTGNPRRRFEERSVDELRNLASQRHVAGASGMSKTQLIEALRGKRRG
jgi:plasmid stabilization system protein ParE